MLNVITLEEALQLIREEFAPAAAFERVPLASALGRTLAEDVTSEEYVPDFDRSTVDGFAARARDTFGCSEAIPAILTVQADIRMGESAGFVLKEGCCASIPTGGSLPEGADSVVMIEYAEDFGDGTIGVAKAVAPGENLIFRGDDVRPGKILLKSGKIIRPQDIGALAAVGVRDVQVRVPLRIGIISTGDELIDPSERPAPGQIRDVNSLLVASQLKAAGAETVSYGIIPDDEELLRETVSKAVSECSAVILSGGSSVGIKDASYRVISSFGPVLFHGLAMKPGKPTILGKCGNKPIVGLPGHPVAAFFVTRLLVLPLIALLGGKRWEPQWLTARLTENVSANQGRAFYCPCRLRYEGDTILAEPIRTKSGLITTLTDADGYFCVERDREGLTKGAEVRVYRLTEE